jgi:hypothetical protein
MPEERQAGHRKEALPGPVVTLCQNFVLTGSLSPEPSLSALPPPPAAEVTALDVTKAASAKVFLVP